jgi:hypothetical protein
MYAAIFGDFFVLGVIVVVAVVALPWWAVVDVATRPKASFAPTGLSKRAWLLLLIGFTVFTFFIGLGIALHYALRERPKMHRPASADEPVPRLLRSTMVFFLVIASLALPYGVERATSLLSTSNLQAAIEGHLRGQCTSGSSSPAGRIFSVVLTNSHTGKVEDVASIAGNTGLSDFYFDVTPGEYELTATSGSVSHHWGLSFSSSNRSAPTIPTPVAMSVPITVVCK